MEHPQTLAAANWLDTRPTLNGLAQNQPGQSVLRLLFAVGILCFWPANTPAANHGSPARSFHFATGDTTLALWKTWTPREEISPAFTVDRETGHAGKGSLKIAANNRAAYGAWRTTVEGLTGGRTYRFTAFYKAKGVPHERRSIIARLEWQDGQGKAVRPPDYALDIAREGEWTRVEYLTPVPPETRRLDVQLSLGFAAGAVVWWDDLTLTEESSPPQRIVRAATVYCRPRSSKGPADSVEQFCRLAEGISTPDLVCLPEGITVVGTGKTYAEVSEPIPGPTTERLARLARKLNSYVVAGIYERIDPVVYNTAVLLDRTGRLVGTYRKTHLPREEWEAGITPGDSYPVFDTEFGKVGLMICWDLQFPEAARALALRGAEIILLPIWGGSPVLAQARAIENHVFLVSSSYDMRTFIVDPSGKILAEATQEGTSALAELHLDRPIFQPWLGNMKTRTWKERRPDLPLEK